MFGMHVAAAGHMAVSVWLVVVGVSMLARMCVIVTVSKDARGGRRCDA